MVHILDLILGVAKKSEQLCNVHDLRTCSSFRIDSQVLTGDDSSAPRFAECLHVDTLKGVLGRIVLQNSDSPGIGPNNQEVLAASG